MKRLIYTTLIIPLVIYSQGVFAASFSYGSQSYTTPSPSSLFMKKNNQNLVNEACQYDKQLKEDMKKLERCPQNTLNDIYKNNAQQNTPSLNSERQTEPPNWWRWESSYEDWKFD